MVCLGLLFIFGALGCGTSGGADPLVGEWKSVSPSAHMSFHVDPPKNGVYAVTWTNSSGTTAGEGPGVTQFTLERTNSSLYTENDGAQASTFTLGGVAVSVKYIDAHGRSQRLNFAKTGQ